MCFQPLDTPLRSQHAIIDNHQMHYEFENVPLLFYSVLKCFYDNLSLELPSEWPKSPNSSAFGVIAVSACEVICHLSNKILDYCIMPRDLQKDDHLAKLVTPAEIKKHKARRIILQKKTIAYLRFIL